MKQLFIWLFVISLFSCDDENLSTAFYFGGERRDTIKIERLIVRDSCETLYEGLYIPDLMFQPELKVSDPCVTFILSTYEDTCWVRQSYVTVNYKGNAPKHSAYLAFKNKKGLIHIRAK